ncbi:MAG: VTT domain-containing protein [Candidatus Paceibacterota bacterium]|jgi:uncharacterized membrane protein YdjX (TVP38/TMEM64 family)
MIPELISGVLSINSFLGVILFIIVRAIAIIIPPIPGVIVDLPGAISFGWLLGLIYGEIGIMLGATVSFFIAKRFREPLVKRFVSLQKIHAWEDKLSENDKFWGLFSIRLFANPIFFDVISYAAGLTKIKFSKFFIATFISNVPYMFLIYYFGEASFNMGIYYFISFILALFIIWAIFGRFINKLVFKK